MAQRNSRNRIVAEPLFNYSQRRTASHQITASDPSTTGQTHLNYRTTGVHDPIPRPNEPEDMEIDAELPELEPMSDSDDEDDGVDEVPGIRVKKPRAKRYINTDSPMDTWIDFRDEYMDELMRSEGRADFAQGNCPGCAAENPSFRCKDCTAGPMWCLDCVLLRHNQNPLHRVEQWNGQFFKRQTLQELGLFVQLAHPPHRYCPRAEQGHKKFVVIHTNGIHNVTVNYCRCKDISHRQQLMRIGWYPATPLEPQTCATVEVLRLFHLLNLQGKLPAYAFYKSLELATDNTGLLAIPDRQSAFVRMVRQFRHLTLAKRAARAYDPSGIDGTSPGEFALICPACPQPGINLPVGWENASPDRSWLYQLVLGMDANFRLKSRLRGSLARDPALGPGFGYFVEYAPYAKFINSYVDQDDIQTCVGFQALLNMLTKNSKGLRATGTAAVSCARHELFRPLGVGDLQKGERQCNMDYLFASSIMKTQVRLLLISYDVACQWFINFWRRMPKLPRQLHLTLPRDRVFPKVPKFHLQNHEDQCHGPYAFNYTTGGARTDGEGVERNWKGLNGQAPSTSEMGAGSRVDTLDDCCGHMNWRKMVSMGNLFLKRMLQAIPPSIKSRRDFDAFDVYLRQEHSSQVDDWLQELTAWMTDKSLPDPFRLPVTEETLAHTRLALAEEEKTRVDEGHARTYEVSPSTFILLGIDIQGVQALLRRDVAGQSKPTTLQTTSVIERRTLLAKRISRFREIQEIYMPGVDAQVLAHALRTSQPPSAHSTTTSSTARPASIHIEDAKLFLPSELTRVQRNEFCTHDVASIEERIRYSEASDALEKIRRQLRTRTFTNQFKIKNVTGQRLNTRSRAAQSTIDEGVKMSQLRYTRARAALLVLRGAGEWESYLQVLTSADVRGLNERGLTDLEKAEERQVRATAGIPEDEDEIDDIVVIAKPVEVGEGHRRPSWIWYSTSMGTDMTDPVMRDALRVEWAKAKSRADRWEEEVRLLDEEMRRVMVYCRWKADWWRNQIGFREDADEPVLQGLKAYAEEHSALMLEQADSFGAKWYVVRQEARSLIEKAFGESAVSEPLMPPSSQAVITRLVLDTVDEEPDVEAMDSDFEE